MPDIIEVLKNIQDVYAGNNNLGILKDFERVLDELDLYVYENWEDGELVEGPTVNRYTVGCKFMWPKDKMPDPEGGQRLLEYDCKVMYKRDHLLVPRKVLKPSDYRPGSKKGKIDKKDVWLVEIIMPKKLMQDIYQGYVKKENDKMGDDMQMNTQSENMVPDVNAAKNAEAGNV
jgi:hypothetical protein